MLYRALKTIMIQLGPKESQDFDAQTGVVFVPQPNSKIYLHWLTESGKLRQTYTMTFATQAEGKLKLINGLDNPTSIQVIQVD
jgi:outer membrane receptor for monomeric catechols